MHVIVGSGSAGGELAQALAERGERVRVITRSGSGPRGVERCVLDAADPEALTAAVRGADVLYNCANPGNYTLWEKVWPPLASSILTAAERTGAVLVTLSNLYGYGPVDGPMRADTPLRPSDHKGAVRVRMWTQALEAHQAGRARVTEARASDYIGRSLPASHGLLPMAAHRTLAGRRASVFADPDQPHAWSALGDVAATLIALGADERAWGRAWIVPSSPGVSMRAALRGLGERVGAGEPRLRVVPRPILAAGGALVPMLREVRGVLYQFDRPFTVDATETERTFGVRATPWEQVLDDTAPAWRDRTT